MIKLKRKERPKKYWLNKDNIKKAASECTTKTEFHHKYPAGYKSAKDNGWFEEICSHMITMKTPWTKENIIEEAKKYNSVAELQNNGNGCYNAARRDGYLPLVKSFYKLYGNRMKRCIYAYEFPDNHVYVGLTYNLEKRHITRCKNKNDAVDSYKKITGLVPVLNQLTEYIDLEDAVKQEESYLQKYIKDGWIPLNRVATGSVGGDHIRWNYNSCFVEALKYNTVMDLANNSHSAYRAIIRYGWQNEMFAHMQRDRKPKGYWSNKDNCRIEASKYKTITEFENNCSQGCKVSRDNNWLKEFFV